MIRLLAVCCALTWMVGCQYQPRTPVYDPFAAGGQRIAPPATGSLNQPGYYQQAPTYSQPPYTQPTYPAYGAPAYPTSPTYQPPAAYQAPALPQPQIPPGYVPKTSAIPAELSPVSQISSSTSNSYVSSNRNVPTPKPTANWPPKKPIRRAEVLSWNSPGIGGIQQASASTPIYAQPSQTVQPTVFWNDQCIDCDPYATPHIVNPLLPQPAVYAEAHHDYSNVTYAADQSYSGDNWRARSSRRE